MPAAPLKSSLNTVDQPEGAEGTVSALAGVAEKVTMEIIAAIGASAPTNAVRRSRRRLFLVVSLRGSAVMALLPPNVCLRVLYCRRQSSQAWRALSRTRS